jgi:hypothetical protein
LFCTSIWLYGIKISVDPLMVIRGSLSQIEKLNGKHIILGTKSIILGAIGSILGSVEARLINNSTRDHRQYLCDPCVIFVWNYVSNVWMYILISARVMCNKPTPN